MKIYRIWFINFGYFSNSLFASKEQAIEAGKRACFEFAIHEFETSAIGKVVCSWSPIGGLKNA